MVRHIVMWNYKEGYTAEQNAGHAAEIKAGLEGLAQSVPGVVSIKVYAAALPTSNRSVMLDSVFESPEALAAYQTHPEHNVVGSRIKEVFTDRICFDYAD